MLLSELLVFIFLIFREVVLYYVVKFDVWLFVIVVEVVKLYCV